MTGRMVRINDHDPDAWPKILTDFLTALDELDAPVSVLALVVLNHKTRNLSIAMSPHASENPHQDAMCDEISDAFKAMARRLRQ